MREIFIVSDTHFGHGNMLKFTDSATGARVRPLWENVDEMDEYMIQKWNDTVRDEDIIYHLGDVYFAKGREILPRLRGRKRLILGNHDNGKDQNLHKYFEKIMMWRMFPEFGVLLSHVPVHPNTLGFKVNFNIHGHTHLNDVGDPRYFNACVEKINYTPVSVDDILKKLPTL